MDVDGEECVCVCAICMDEEMIYLPDCISGSEWERRNLQLSSTDSSFVIIYTLVDHFGCANQ